MLGRLIKSTSGAAAAEMALIAPLLFILMFGTMELGYYFYSEHVVVKAVRDGARFASRETFDDFTCPAGTVDPTMESDTQKVTRTNTVDGTGDPRLPNWTSDSTVTVTLDCTDNSSATYSSIYDGVTSIPLVTVSATVPYTSLFGLLGFRIDQPSTEGDVASVGDGRMMRPAIINRLWRDCAAAVGAEFAIVLPLLLLLLFGMIDVGRYMWSINELEKATQVGARWAVVTDTVASGLNTKDFGSILGQGAKIPPSAFGKMHCDKFSGTLSCSCDSNCSGIGMTADATAFQGMTDRMSEIAPMLTDQNVRITYTNSGLGYAGDPTPGSPSCTHCYRKHKKRQLFSFRLPWVHDDASIRKRIADHGRLDRAILQLRCHRERHHTQRNGPQLEGQQTREGVASVPERCRGRRR